ncbi:membrane-anchored ubiquitin-fold protein 3 isoform X1 [Corylus avellana]|nr:membrane-anchored ubiquitin-fold protein 3 isoform X1 [Corylus avellana]
MEGVGEEGRRSQSQIQMPEEELVDIKFRLYDGSDMGPFRYSSASTVDMLKQRVVSDWPKGKTIIPKVANEVKLISSGKILENNKTVGQCKMPFGDNAGGVIIMHVVVQPSLAKTKTEKKIDDSPRKIVCSCSIL